MTKGNDHTFNAVKAQEKWPQHGARAGITGLSHQTVYCYQTACGWNCVLRVCKEQKFPEQAYCKENVCSLNSFV